MDSAINITLETLNKHKQYFEIRHNEIENIKKENILINRKNYEIDEKESKLKELLEQKEIYTKENEDMKNILGFAKIINDDIKENDNQEINITLKRYLNRLVPNYENRIIKQIEIEKTISIITKELEILNKMIYIFDDDVEMKIKELVYAQELTMNKISYFEKYLGILYN
jgi:hypothetical protein